jgi:hypothetical protein
MILGSIKDYLFIWQLPIYGIFVIGWLLGAGWLFRRSLDSAAVNRKYTFGHGVLIAFLSGFTGAAAAGLLALALSKYFISKTDTLMVGAIPCLGLFVFFAVQTVLIMHKELGARTAIKASILPVGALLIFSAAVVAVIVPLTLATRGKTEAVTRNIQEAQNKFYRIYRALNRRPEDPPSSLQELVDNDQLKAETLRDPADPDTGFCYLPTRLKRIADKNQIIMCTKRHDKYGDKRVVLFMGGKITELRESGFQSFLKDDKNLKFAELLSSVAPTP